LIKRTPASGIRALSALPIRSGGLSISLSIGATAVLFNTDFDTNFPDSSTQMKNTNEQAIMVGMRW